MTKPKMLSKHESKTESVLFPLTMAKIGFNGVYQSKEPGSVEVLRSFSSSVYEQDEVRLLVLRIHSKVKYPQLEGILSGAAPVTDYIKNAIDYTVTTEGHTILRFIADNTAPEGTNIIAAYNDRQAPVMLRDILDFTVRVMEDLGFDALTQYTVRALVNQSIDALLMGFSIEGKGE